MNESVISEACPGLENATRYHIRFVSQLTADQTAILEFADPAPVKAVRVAEPADDALDILVVSGQPSDEANVTKAMTEWVMQAHRPGMAAPIVITLHGTQVVWHAARIAVLAAPERMESLLLAVIDFAYYERELSKLERDTAESWPQLNPALAFEVANKDLERQDDVRRRVERMLNVRIRLARIAPRLHRPCTHLATLAIQLGERLRERTRMEDRVEFLGQQLDVFERVHEMTSQRFSEFRTSKKETTLEWVIIILLAAEVLLLLLDLIRNLER